MVLLPDYSIEAVRHFLLSSKIADETLEETTTGNNNRAYLMSEAHEFTYWRQHS